MFILDTWGLIRTFLFTIDQVAYSLIDNAYDLINAFASAEFFKDGTVETVMQNTYIIIGLFALFKIALLLVNALINPDKLFDKESGFAIVVRNVIIMFALLIFVPILFKESMNIQNVITEGSYINSLFGLKVSDDYNPGNTFKRQAIKALVKPNEYFAKEVTTDSGNKFEKTDACPDNSTHCKDAIDDYNEAIFGSGDMFDLLSEHMKDYVKVDDNKIYVYDYAVFLTFIVGVAITYLLIVFCFDLAERVIKLAILEIVSPLFIVTYIDPKSAKSGPFKNWLKEVGSTYVGLYIRLVALALILILLNLWDKVDPKVISKLGTLGTIIFILSILIFAKSFPKWLASLIGIKDFDNGIGGLGKRLGSAALVGGMLTKAGHAAAGAATGAAKMVGENRRNRNALRKQARIDSGTTHGKKGHEFRKNQSGGYFAQRKALHDKRKEAYNKANANLLGKEGADKKNAVGRNLKQIGASIVGGAIVGGQAGIKADNIKGTLNAAKGAASQFGQGLGFQGRTIGGAISSGLENTKGRMSDAWGDARERVNAIDEREKRENYRKMYKGNYSDKVPYGDAVLSNGGYYASFKGALGGDDAVKASLATQAQLSGGKISTMDDGKIQIQKTDSNGIVHTAVIDGENRTAIIDGVNQNYSDLVNSGNSFLSSYGQASLKNMQDTLVEQSISTQMSNNAQIGQLMQQKNSVEQSMQYNAEQANSAMSQARGATMAATGVAAGAMIEADNTGRTVNIDSATMDELKYFLGTQGKSGDANFENAKNNYNQATNSYNISSSQVSNINNQISQYQASNNSVEKTIETFRSEKSTRADATLEELQRDAKKEQETSKKAMNAEKEKKE